MDKYLPKIVPDEPSAQIHLMDIVEVNSGFSQDHSPPNRKRKSSTYLNNWEEESDLKQWICKSSNSSAYCKICNIELKTSGGITDLKKHAKSVKHIAKSNAIQMHVHSKTLFTSRNDQVAKAEMQLSAFCAEHNVSFITMDHLVTLLKDAIHDSEIVKQLSCARTKTTALVKNVIGASQMEDICTLMRSNFFSMCIDESTDISTTKLLSIVIRIPPNEQIFDFFRITKDRRKDIDYKRYLVGFAADGANVMTGSNHSVATLLKKDCPYLVVFKCSCHSFALCANHACNFLPKYVESCVRDIYNFIQNSPKRFTLFRELQSLLDYRPKKMLHPSQTRWLSLEQTVTQILSRFNVLRLFFVHEEIDKFDSVRHINDCLQNKQFELYLKFLKFGLNDINNLNKSFQSESPQLHKLFAEIKRLYFKIFQYFVQEKYLTDEYLQNGDLLNNNNIFLDLKQIYLGADIAAALLTTHKLTNDEEVDFRSQCLKFFIELCKHLLKKFDFNDVLLQAFNIISPNSIISKTHISCMKLIRHFPQIISHDEYQQIDDEWREIRLLDFLDLNLSSNMEIDIFWSKIFELKRGDGSPSFPKLKIFIMAILTIPVATANVERIFSQINLNKTKIRNCLEPSTLCGILMIKDFLKKNQQDCTNFKPNKNMYQKFNAKMYQLEN